MYYVAELLNTVSSIVMVGIALIGLWRVRAEGWRFMLGMGGLAVVGLGSAAFHGTLLRVAQAADDLAWDRLCVDGDGAAVE